MNRKRTGKRKRDTDVPTPFTVYTLVGIYISMEKHKQNGKIHFRWPLLIANIGLPEGKKRMFGQQPIST